MGGLLPNKSKLCNVSHTHKPPKRLSDLRTQLLKGMYCHPEALAPSRGDITQGSSEVPEVLPHKPYIVRLRTDRGGRVPRGWKSRKGNPARSQGPAATAVPTLIHRDLAKSGSKRSAPCSTVSLPLGGCRFLDYLMLCPSVLWGGPLRKITAWDGCSGARAPAHTELGLSVLLS